METPHVCFTAFPARKRSCFRVCFAKKIDKEGGPLPLNLPPLAAAWLRLGGSELPSTVLGTAFGSSLDSKRNQYHPILARWV